MSGAGVGARLAGLLQKKEFQAPLQAAVALVSSLPEDQESAPVLTDVTAAPAAATPATPATSQQLTPPATVPLEEISKADGEQVNEKEETTKAGEELVASLTHRLKGKTVASTQDAPSLEAVNQEEHGGDSNIHDVSVSHPVVNNAGEPAS